MSTHCCPILTSKSTTRLATKPILIRTEHYAYHNIAISPKRKQCKKVQGIVEYSGICRHISVRGFILQMPLLLVFHIFSTKGYLSYVHLHRTEG